ncbi:MAG: Gfo/Idh/MocA family oxidoreductase [Planctomycetota bacterium]|nr:Gfo/Idh/MocA family oxidoreductase [Planctomycetota bacterium]
MRIPKLSRRSVLASSALLAAPALGQQAAKNQTQANDHIQVGVIGLGSRGYNLVDALIRHRDKVRIIAVCDVDQKHYRDRTWGTGTSFGLFPGQQRIEAAYDKAGTGTKVDPYSDFRELFDRDDIDAVVIATPDHWHAFCTLQAIKAGKDVYCEKPVTHWFSEGQQVYRQVAKQQTVFQTGSQQRSDWRFRRAVELVRNGHLGQMTKVEVGLPRGYDKPQDNASLAKIPEGLDYDFWCGPATKLPYMRARHHRWWRGHSAFGGGVLMDWIGHHNDIAHWALDTLGPIEVEAEQWIFPTTEIYDTPEQYTIRSRYEGGVESTISTRNQAGLKLIGTDGWLRVNRGKLQTSDPRWAKQTFEPGSKRIYHSDDHMENFLDCLRTRKPCIAPAETAHRSITPGHLGYVSQKLGRKLTWDPAREVVLNDQRASDLLATQKYRSPWNV